MIIDYYVLQVSNKQFFVRGEVQTSYQLVCVVKNNNGATAWQEWRNF